MKSFFINIFRFSIPFIIYTLLVMYIDPYNVIQIEKNKKLSDIKSEISLPLNNRLYKLSNFSNNPTDVILLGDSRVYAINASYFNKINAKKSTNLAYGGGTLKEIIETFWYITNNHKVKEVYIGVNFEHSNKHNDINRVKEAIDLRNFPIKYLFSKDCFKSSFLIVKSLLSKKKINIDKPNLDKEGFWKYQIESSADNQFRIYSYSNEYFTGLTKISNYCKLNNIKLKYFSLPVHTDIHKKIKQYNRIPELTRFKSDMSKLGLYYDFDYPNEITKNKNLFKDPFHTNDSVTKIVVNEIVTAKIKYARTY